MSADHEGPPTIEQARKAEEQSSTLLGVMGFLNNYLGSNPEPTFDDLVKLNRGLHQLARRLHQSKRPLPDIELTPGRGLRAVQINSRDLEEQHPPAPIKP